MNEYTKHYYAGAERVAACLGGGGLDIVLGNNLTEPTAPAYSTPWGGLFDNGSTDPEEVIVNDTIVMLQEASTKLFEQSGWQVNQRELNGNELNCIAEIDAYHAELHRTIAGLPDRMSLILSPPILPAGFGLLLLPYFFLSQRRPTYRP